MSRAAARQPNPPPNSQPALMRTPLAEEDRKGSTEHDNISAGAMWSREALWASSESFGRWMMMMTMMMIDDDKGALSC